MGYRPITPKLYLSLVRVFAEGKSKRQVGFACNVGVDFVNTAWHRGWAKEGYLPIKDVVQDPVAVSRADQRLRDIEAVEVRDRQTVAHQEELKKTPEADAVAITSAFTSDSFVEIERIRKDAREAVAQAIVEERKMVRTTRGIAAFTLTRALRLLDATRTIQERAEYLATNDAAGLSLDQCLSIMRQVGKISEHAVSLAREAMTMERLHTGRPTDITEHHVDLSGLSDEALDGELRMVEAAIKATTGYKKGNGHAEHMEVTDDGNGTPAIEESNG
mgnify:CR=1 FL=1